MASRADEPNRQLNIGILQYKFFLPWRPMPFIFLLRDLQRANYALSLIASFLSRLYPTKVAKLDRSRRQPKAFGIPSNLLTGDPFERPVSAERSAFDV